MGAVPSPSEEKIYITYAERPAYPGDLDIYVASSNSVAGPWTITRVNDDLIGNGKTQMWPALGVAPNGRIDLIWYDFRTITSTQSLLNIYYTASQDGGNTWEVNTKVTDVSPGYTPTSLFAGDYHTVVSVNEKAVAVWMDNRVGNPEIYTATLMMPAPLQWNIETIDSVGLVGHYTSLKLDSSGNPHISYYDWGNGDLKYARKIGGVWAIEPVDSAGDVGSYSSLALDSNGNPHIGYYDGTNDELKYAQKVGGSWNLEVVLSAIWVVPGVSGAVSLALDPIWEYPHISFKGDGSELVFASRNNGVWDVRIAEYGSALGPSTSLALDVDMTIIPHISYQGPAGLKYAMRDHDGWWRFDSIGPYGDFGAWSSIALDAARNPVIAYSDDTNGDLKFARKLGWSFRGGLGGNVWSITTIDSAGYAGNFASMALGPGDSPHISYYDASNQDLKYAYASAGGAPAATGAGPVAYSSSAGTFSGLTAVAEASLPTTGKPAGVTFPYGFFSWTIGNLAPGQAVTVTITYPANIPSPAQYWKVIGGVWTNVTSLIGDDDGDNVLTLTITDGGTGDADGIVNGQITDPGGLAAASVELILHKLVVEKTGAGSGTVTSDPPGIACGANCTADFPLGTAVILMVTPNEGYLFTGWSGHPDCADGVVTMLDETWCVATFDPITGEGWQQKELDRLRQSSTEFFDLQLSNTGAVNFADFRLPLPPAAGETNLTRAQWFFSEYMGLLRLSDPVAELQLTRTSPDGMHLFFQQYYKDVPVFPAQLAIHFEGTDVTGLGGNYLPEISVSPIPALGSGQAIEEISAAGIEVVALMGDPALWFINLGLLGHEDQQTYLTWRIPVETTTGHWVIFVDAHKGGIAYIQTLDYEAFSLSLNTLQNTDSRGTLCYFFTFSDVEWFNENGPRPNPNPPIDNEGNIAFSNIQTVYNYWMNHLGRDSHKWERGTDRDVHPRPDELAKRHVYRRL